MTIEKLQAAVQELRTVELRRSVRGVDPEQTRELLDQAVDALTAAAREQDELRSEVDRLREANDESAISKALLTATRAADELIAEARQQAASRSAEAEEQATALLEQVKTQAEKREQETKAAREQLEREFADARKNHANELESARADADAALAAARRELAQLEKQAAKLGPLVTGLERRIVEIAQGALKELEALGDSAGSTAKGDMLADLQPVAEPPDVAAEPDHGTRRRR